MENRRDGTGHRANTSVVAIKAAAAYPFIWFAPTIDYDVAFVIERKRDGSVYVKFLGWHGAFPAYEVLIDNQVEYAYHPQDPGPTIANLSGWKTVSVGGDATILPPR
jgi:hypothetical protein